MSERKDPAERELARRVFFSPSPGQAPAAHASAHELLAAAREHFQQGHPDRAEHLLRQLLEALPSSTGVKLELAGLYCGTRRYDRALPLVDAVLAEDSDNTAALARRAEALYNLNRVDEAISTIECAIGVDPTMPDFHNDLGVFLQAAGQFEQAVDCFHKAIDLNPHYLAPYHNLLDIPGDVLPTALARNLRELLEKPGLAEHDSALVSFCLSRYYRHRGEPGEEFRYLRRAKNLMAKLQNWDEEAFAADVGRILKLDAADCLRLANRRQYSPAPVVICSMPRAGSTLLEQIIGAHPEITTTGEAGMATRACQDAARRRQLSDPLFAAWFSQPEAAEIFGDAFAALRDSANTHQVRTRWFTEKSANNDLLAGLWLMAYPDARIIHIRRDPLDVCLSCYQTFFSAGVPYSNRLDWLARRYEIHERLMRHWIDLFPSRFLTVRYEDLVLEPSPHVETILKFIGLDWDDNWLQFPDASNAVRSASNWQVRQPLYTSSVHRWRAYRDQLAEILHLAEHPPI